MDGIRDARKALRAKQREVEDLRDDGYNDTCECNFDLLNWFLL